MLAGSGLKLLDLGLGVYGSGLRAQVSGLGLSIRLGLRLGSSNGCCLLARHVSLADGRLVKLDVGVEPVFRLWGLG